VQDPHPPIFAACSKPESAEQVGALGIGALNFAIGNDEYLGKKVAGYRKAFASSPETHYAKTNHFACTPVALCLDDDRAACAAGFRGAAFFSGALATYYLSGKRPTGRLPIQRDPLREQDLDAAMQFRMAQNTLAMNVIGDPAHCREIVSRYVKAGVDELILVMQTGTVPHELILRSIRTFAENVMPHFA
jgi:alkanesulfonate monooxygenase SsuD/methylene tetrahydromethanopterin reductase-like flavin-dependent oxidoreductase (luciferase family)